MTGLRHLIVTATIAGSIGLSLASLAMDRVLWPFSQYPMYSSLAGPSTAITRAVGVVGDGRELPLPRRIEPTGLHLHAVVDHTRAFPDAAARLTRIATSMWTEYEQLRAVGEIEGPPFTAVRIYRDTIQLATKRHIRSAFLMAQGP